jgi:hypothetical protein
MIAAHPPLQLPFGPKPFRKELLSSWLLRLAAANCVSLPELLLGFEASYPSAAYSISLDLNLGLEFLTCMAQLSRVPATTLECLSLEKRVAHSSSSLLLGFSTDNFNSDLRLHSRRTGYAFCPLCLAGQSVVHVPWEWAFVYLRHCSIHGKQLRSDCMSFGTQDPLPFGFIPTAGNIPCHWCRENLLEEPDPRHHPPPLSAVVLEKAYRAALIASSAKAPSIGRDEKDRFRQFVDDMLRLIPDEPQERNSRTWRGPRLPRAIAKQNLAATISQLVACRRDFVTALER